MPIDHRTMVGVFALGLCLVIRADAQLNHQNFVTYPCQQKEAAEVARILRPLLPDLATVQLVVDRDRNRLLLSGSDEVQAIARRVMDEIPRQGDREPWLNPQNYKRDRHMFRRGKLEDGALLFSNPESAISVEPICGAS